MTKFKPVKVCIDCNKEVSQDAKRCNSCARKYQYKITPQSNPMFGKSGKLNPNWKDRKKIICTDCHKELSIMNYPLNTIKHKRCKSCENKRRYKDKKNHPNWQGGISFEPYGLEFNNKLREQIRKRDRYRCQECFRRQSELKIKLNIHHIDFNKQNNNPQNLIALCNSCHMKTNYNRNNWAKYFKDIINKK